MIMKNLRSIAIKSLRQDKTLRDHRDTGEVLVTPLAHSDGRPPASETPAGHSASSEDEMYRYCGLAGDWSSWPVAAGPDGGHLGGLAQ